MLVSFKLLSLYSILKHIQEQPTKNILWEGLFLVVPNQFIGERYEIFPLLRLMRTSGATL